MKNIIVLFAVFCFGFFALSLNAFAQDDEKTKVLNEVYDLLDVKKYDEVIKVVGDFVRKYPDEPSAYFYRGLAYHEKKQFEKAIADYDKAIELKDNDATFYSARGKSYFALGNYDAAIEDHSAELGIVDERVLGYLGRGNALWMKKQYDTAVKDFSSAVGHSDFPSMYFRRGTAYKERGEKQKAVEDLLIFIEEFPDYQPARKALLELGLSEKDLPKPLIGANEKIPAAALEAFYAGLERLTTYEREDAKAEFKIAVQHYPKFAQAFYMLGFLEHDAVNYGNAVRNYTTALEINPKFIEAVRGKALSYRFNGRDAEALREINKAIALAPASSKNYVVRAFITSKPAQRILDLTKAITLNPKDFEAFKERSSEYAEKKLWTKALDDINKAIALRPNNFEGYWKRAEIYCRQGNKELAAEDEKKAADSGAPITTFCSEQ